MWVFSATLPDGQAPVVFSRLTEGRARDARERVWAYAVNVSPLIYVPELALPWPVVA
jgi:hypothetical protein